MQFVEILYSAQWFHYSNNYSHYCDSVEGVMLGSIATVLLLMQAAPASVDGAPANSDADRKICKREKQIGSLVRGKKICRTKSEWDAAEAQARQDVGEMQRTTRAPPNG